MTLLYKFCSSCKLTSSKLTTFSCLRPLNRSFVASRIVSDLDSTTATIEQALHQVKSDDAGKLFPWRNRPFHRAHSSILQRFLSFGFISLINNSESNFLEGSKQAFRIGSQAIFSHVIPDTKQEHKIDLSSIFQDELAHFYTLAIRDFHHHNNKKIVYDLIAIKHAKIVDTEFVVWKSDLVKSGSIPFVEKIGYFTYVSNPDKEFNPAESDRLSVLIRVDLKCRELFNVKNKYTEEIIQGSEEPEIVIHQILLRATFRVSGLTLEPTQSWILEDLDEWVRDAETWCHNHIKHN